MARRMALADLEGNPRKARRGYAQVGDLLSSIKDERPSFGAVRTAMLPSWRFAQAGADKLAAIFEALINVDGMTKVAAQYSLRRAAPLPRRQRSTRQGHIREAFLHLTPDNRELLKVEFRRQIQRICLEQGVAVSRNIAGSSQEILEMLAFAFITACATVAETVHKKAHPEREFVYPPNPAFAAGRDREVSNKLFSNAMYEVLRARAAPQLAEPARVAATFEAMAGLGKGAPPNRAHMWFTTVAAITKQSHPADLSTALGFGLDERAVEKARSLKRRIQQKYKDAEFLKLCELRLMTPEIASWLAVEGAVDPHLALKAFQITAQTRAVVRAFQRWIQ